MGLASTFWARGQSSKAAPSVRLDPGRSGLGSLSLRTNVLSLEDTEPVFISYEEVAVSEDSWAEPLALPITSPGDVFSNGQAPHTC